MLLTVEVPKDINAKEFTGESTAAIKWLGELWEALKPLVKLEVPGSSSSVHVWFRVRDQTGAACIWGGNEPFDFDRPGDERSRDDQDSDEKGWWVFSLDIPTPSESYREYVGFFSKDFMDDAGGAREKFEKVWRLLGTMAPLPAFSPNRIARALAVFDEKEEK